MYTTYGEGKNKEALEHLTDESHQFRSELDILKAMSTSLNDCMTESIDSYSNSEQFDRAKAAMEIQTRWQSGYDHMYYFQYMPEPTSWLSQQLSGKEATFFYPYKIRSLNLISCQSFQHFLDTSLDAYEKLTPTYMDDKAREELVYPVFSLSLKFCGGYLNSEELTSDHLCFSLVTALLNLSEKGDKKQVMKHIYQNPFSSHSNESLFLPVLGSFSTSPHDSPFAIPHHATLKKYTLSKKSRLLPSQMSQL